MWKPKKRKDVYLWRASHFCHTVMMWRMEICKQLASLINL